MRFRPRTSPYALAEAGSDAEAAVSGKQSAQFTGGARRQVAVPKCDNHQRENQWRCRAPTMHARSTPQRSRHDASSRSWKDDLPALTASASSAPSMPVDVFEDEAVAREVAAAEQHDDGSPSTAPAPQRARSLINAGYSRTRSGLVGTDAPGPRAHTGGTATSKPLPRHARPGARSP